MATGLGIEVELVLDSTGPFVDRIAFAGAVAAELDLVSVGSATLAAVPVPPEIELEASLPALVDVASRHGALEARLAPDLSCLLLRYAAARLESSDSVFWEFVHDQTLAGGDRVVEIVSRPAPRTELENRIRLLLSALRRLGGYHFSDSCALHVHLDATELGGPLLRELIVLWSQREARLREHLGTPAGLSSASPLPAELVSQVGSLSRDAERCVLVETLRPWFRESPPGWGLNLANIVAGSKGKPTLEFKIAPASDDEGLVFGAIECFVSLVDEACRRSAPALSS